MADKRKQAENQEDGREALLAALNRAAREASGLGAMFGQAVASRLGINQTDLECIDFIALRGRVSAGELAAETGLTTGAVTGVIDRLERAGYAERERDPEDRRKIYVRVLPAALRTAGRFYRSLERAVDRLAGRYDDEQLALLVDYFTRARDVMLREIESLTARPNAAADSHAAGGPADPVRVRSPRRGGAAATPRPRRPPR